MGRPYARWSLYCAVTAACLLFGGGSDHTFSRTKKEADVSPLLRHPHNYSTNLWWQLMNRTAYEGNEVNCYVCAQLPYATHNSGLRPGNITDEKQMCLYGLSTHPWRSFSAARNNKRSKRNYSIPLRTGAVTQRVLGAMDCSPVADVLPFPQTLLKLPEIISLAGAKPGSLGNCVYNNGTASLGMVPWSLCNKVYTFCERTQRFINCTDCKGQRLTQGCSAWKDNPDCHNLLQERRFNITQQMRGRQEMTRCSAIVPGDDGSRAMADWYFLCGNVAYVAMPRNWGGLCALVPLISPIAFIREAQHAPFSRSKWAIMPEVKRWGGLTTSPGVPWEFRIWGGGEKFMQSLFPWVGLAEIREHIESNRYALLRLINSMHELANGTVRELTELRIVVLQNRVVLDFLIASHGGVCKIIGSTCCTFIPDETGTGGTISEALRELEELKHYADSGTHGSYSFDFLTWLTSGTWWNLLLRIGIPILGVLILFCLFTSCFIPCLRSMVLKTFSTAVISYQLVKTTSDTHEDDLFHMDEDALKSVLYDDVL